MTFDEYQAFTRTTAIYPKAVAMPYLTAGLAEEAGEVAGKFKKSIRDGWTAEKFEEAVVAELGDVLWYLARYADELGYSLQSIAEMNQIKLQDRKDRAVLQGSGDTR